MRASPFVLSTLPTALSLLFIDFGVRASYLGRNNVSNLAGADSYS